MLGGRHCNGGVTVSNCNCAGSPANADQPSNSGVARYVAAGVAGNDCPSIPSDQPSNSGVARYVAAGVAGNDCPSIPSDQSTNKTLPGDIYIGQAHPAD